jgi:hypothetical protein
LKDWKKSFGFREKPGVGAADKYLEHPATIALVKRVATTKAT